LMNNTESPWEGKNIREELRGTLWSIFPTVVVNSKAPSYFFFSWNTRIPAQSSD
jgi:hypothetical protein